MGLDELIPDDANTSSSSSSSRGGGGKSSGGLEKNYVVEFSSSKGTKKFTEEQWEKIKDIIRKETDYKSVGEVKSLPADERHDVLHELAIEAFLDDKEGDISRSDTRCAVCGDDCSSRYVIVEGDEVHPHHPLMKVANELGLEVHQESEE